MSTSDTLLINEAINSFQNINLIYVVDFYVDMHIYFKEQTILTEG